MSVYSHRDRSAYGNFLPEPKFAQNKHILKWWTSAHDQLIAQQIDKEPWCWYWGLTDAIVANTPKEVIENWRKEDPVCAQFAWYNVLMHFAAARAEILGSTERIRKPTWKTCPLCGYKLVEDSLPYPLIERFGINHLDCCSPCLQVTVLQNSGNPKLSRQEIVRYLQDLAHTLEKVPTQNFGEGIHDFRELDFNQRLAILKVLKRKPTIGRVKEVFGSWLKALIEAGILEDGTRRTSYGIQTVARDGHICLSLGERTIDDFLYSHEIPHEKEPHYPEGNFRADFLVNGAVIEYFGLKGNPEYDAKIKLKQKICKRHGITLIALYPADLVSTKNLERKLTEILT